MHWNLGLVSQGAQCAKLGKGARPLVQLYEATKGHEFGCSLKV